MILIDEIEVANNNIRFYNGIDFDMIKKHPKDGSNGFIYFFIDKWENEVKIQERNNRISTILGDESEMDIHEIDNNYVVIYQTDGNTEIIYSAIRKKVENGTLIKYPWLPIANDVGAFKINNNVIKSKA